MSDEAARLDMVERLRQHRSLADVPESELLWLAERGVLRRFAAGDHFVREGDDWRTGAFGLEIVLSGRLATYQDRGAGLRKVMDWQAGDITGVYPFSRMGPAIGQSIAETPLATLTLGAEHFPELIRDCPNVTAVCVHMMLNRARVFNTKDLQDEKMVSLGKLTAGLAHELNNPASAVARSARLMQTRMGEADRAARQLARLGLTADQLEAVDRVRGACAQTPHTVSMSPLERAEREDEIADWLLEHGADGSAVDALAETAVTVDALEELARHLGGEALDAALDWVAAGCAVRTLALESERAGSKISELVSAMKRLTHMDRAPAAEPVDIEQGLRDALMVLGHKARDKSLSVKVDVAPDLPPVNAVEGELEQIWMNLVDNALDAVDVGGHLSVTAKPEGRGVVVRIVDDGPGIPAEHQRKIFDPFFTTKPTGSGTGLGLDIARAHARRHGGDIDFDSRPGRTEFRVTLPLAGAVTAASYAEGGA
jgi:signal transduction histidine kinase